VWEASWPFGVDAFPERRTSQAMWACLNLSVGQTMGFGLTGVAPQHHEACLRPAVAHDPTAEDDRGSAGRAARSSASNDSVHWGSASAGVRCEAPSYAGIAGIAAAAI
jgi:hypothetical protein